MKRRDESGQMIVFACGLTLTVFAVAGIAVDGARVFLARRSLQNSADGAAVSAASLIDTSLYYRTGGTRIRLEPARAQAHARQLIARRGLKADVVVETTTAEVRVFLATETETTFLRLIGIRAIDVTAEARAEPLPQAVLDEAKSG